MGKITGIEKPEQLPAKVTAMYDAVKMLMERGHYALDLSVSMITEQAGIGKGTAYEYFESKEELLACALAYQVQEAIGAVYRELEKRESFREQLNAMLDLEERHQDEKEYLMRFMNILTDNTLLSHLVQQKMESYVEAYGQEEADEFKCGGAVTILLGKMIAQGRERGEIRTDQPAAYQVYALGAKLLTYMVYQCGEKNSTLSRKEMHGLVLEGILEELGNR